MSRLRLQASPCSSGQRAWYTVNLDGVPLGCQDDLRSDPALVINVENEVATIPHRFRERIDGAMLFLEKNKHRARSTEAVPLRDFGDWMEFWPCDANGNKVRWPTSADGEML